MSTSRFVALLVLGSLACLQSFAERPVAVSDIASWQDQQRSDVEFLASEELLGRDVANDTIQVAADYVAARMSALGLGTNLIDDTPFQPLEITLGAQAGRADSNRIVFATENSERLTASLGDGFNPLAIGSSGGQITGPIALVGYGVSAPKFNYDDYAGIDVSGAVVIVFRKEPGYNNPDSPFDGTRNTPHAYFATKVEKAIARGAAAVIIVNDPTSILGSVQNERSKIHQEETRKQAIKKQIENLPNEAVNIRRSLQKKLNAIDKMVAATQIDLKRAERGVMGVAEAGNRPTKDQTIPVVSVARDVVDQLVRQTTGRALDDIQKQIDTTSIPQSVMLANAKATLRVELKPTTATSSNVIGVLPGRGSLAQESVVIGAHYDHVGMGGYGSLAPGTVAVHNGADDNASGVATLLGTVAVLKERLKEMGAHRRLVFIAFTGEERGLVGSKYYVRHPRFPLESTAAMINLDMVGRLRDNELTLYGTGSASLLDQIVDQSNARHRFNLFKVPTGYGPSDHQSFYEAGVPVLFFFTGLHNDYHRPSDDFDKIDFGGMTRITDMVSDVTYQLAIRKERPEYAETENRVRIRRQLTAYMGANLSNRGDHVVLSGVTSGGPAERGGLRIGDRLDRLGKRRVRTAADVLDLLRSRSPGDQLQVSVDRRGQKIEVTVRLEARPSG